MNGCVGTNLSCSGRVGPSSTPGPGVGGKTVPSRPEAVDVPWSPTIRHQDPSPFSRVSVVLSTTVVPGVVSTTPTVGVCPVSLVPTGSSRPEVGTGVYVPDHPSVDGPYSPVSNSLSLSRATSDSSRPSSNGHVSFPGPIPPPYLAFLPV